MMLSKWALFSWIFVFSVAPLFYGFYGTMIFEKTDSGACRSSFFMENPSQARNFSIWFLKIAAQFHWVKCSFIKKHWKNRKIMMLSKWALFSWIVLFSVAPLFYGFYGTMIFEKTDSGACHWPFFIKYPSQARNFSIWFLNIGVVT